MFKAACITAKYVTKALHFVTDVLAATYYGSHVFEGINLMDHVNEALALVQSFIM
jgi:hypothetical protein